MNLNDPDFISLVNRCYLAKKWKRTLSSEASKIADNYTEVLVKFKCGDIVDIHQTINGQNLFILYALSEEEFELRYAHDIENSEGCNNFFFCVFFRRRIFTHAFQFVLQRYNLTLAKWKTKNLTRLRVYIFLLVYHA